MFLIGGDKDDEWRVDFHHPLHHRKAVKAGHLDVEKHQIGLFGLDLAYGIAAIGAGVDDLDIGEFGQAQLQPLNGQLFIVYEDGADGHG